jgi:hypothetical protein
VVFIIHTRCDILVFGCEKEKRAEVFQRKTTAARRGQKNHKAQNRENPCLVRRSPIAYSNGKAADYG